jgi:hypothetical protein
MIYLHELPWYLPIRDDKILKEKFGAKAPKCGEDNKSTNL